MSRVLMTVWPIETHLSPFLAVAHALAARGHSVAFYTSGRAVYTVEHQGFVCFPFREVDSHHAACNPGSAAARKMGLRARRKMWRDFLLGSVPGQLRDLEWIRNGWRPEIVVCDITMWGPILTAGDERQPPCVVLSHPAYCLLAGRDHPAPGISLPPPRTPVARLGARLLNCGLNIVTGSIRRQASRIRREIGLPPLETTVIDSTGRLALHLVPSAPEFDYHRQDLPSSVRYVGPCLGDDAGLPAPDWVTRFRARPRIIVPEELHSPEDRFLFKTVIQALAGHSAEVILVAGQGRGVPAIDAQRAPNIEAVKWTSLSQAISGADLVIAHGNSETVLTALNGGIPMLVVPRMLEQPQVAWRVASSGAGLRLPMRQCTPRNLRDAADRLLQSSAFARNARRIGASFGRMGGPARAAELIERLDPNRRLSRERTA